MCCSIYFVMLYCSLHSLYCLSILGILYHSHFFMFLNLPLQFLRSYFSLSTFSLYVVFFFLTQSSHLYRLLYFVFICLKVVFYSFDLFTVSIFIFLLDVECLF